MDTETNQVSEMWGVLNQWVKMEVDEEKQSAKRPRSTMSNGGKGQGKGKGKKDRGRSRAPRTNPHQIQTACCRPSSLVLRHEDTFQRLATDGLLRSFLSAGPGSVFHS